HLRRAQPVLRRAQCCCCGCPEFSVVCAAHRDNCAARNEVVLGLGFFWSLRRAQVCAAPRAGLLVRVDFC
ncbi:hypothetical protein A2U01_0103438, partial [Trifolium medium]|nr:hypothetical protein [Trifolium medium]